jgi:hypothetical protein
VKERCEDKQGTLGVIRNGRKYHIIISAIYLSSLSYGFVLFLRAFVRPFALLVAGLFIFDIVLRPGHL